MLSQNLKYMATYINFYRITCYNLVRLCIYLHLKCIKILEYICYDDGCHLKKYSKHPSRCDLTPTTRYLSQTNIVIDKMHMVGHVDSWCKKECDPHLFPDLNKVSKLVLYIYNLAILP